MTLFAQCDRCREFAETVPTWYGAPPQPPKDWVNLREFGYPIKINEPWMLPDGGLEALLCPACAPIVRRAAKAAIERAT